MKHRLSLLIALLFLSSRAHLEEMRTLRTENENSL